MRNTLHNACILIALLLVSTGVFAQFTVGCEEGVRVDMITYGILGESTDTQPIATLVNSQGGDPGYDANYVTKVELQAFHKGTSSVPACVTFTLYNGGTVVGTCTANGITAGQSANDVYYECDVNLGSATRVTDIRTEVCGGGTDIYSVVAYVFSEPPGYLGAFSGMVGTKASLWYGRASRNDLLPGNGTSDDCTIETFSVPAATSARDIDLKFAFGEFTGDCRVSYVKMTPVGAGAYTPVEAYFDDQNAGDEAAYGNVIMPNVPAFVTAIEILVCSKQDNQPFSGCSGQSAIYSGVFIDAGESCEGNCGLVLGPVTDSDCGEDNGAITATLPPNDSGGALLYNYDLFLGNSVVQSSGNTPSNTFSFTNLAPGSYRVLVTGTNGCVNDIPVVVIGEACTDPPVCTNIAGNINGTGTFSFNITDYVTDTDGTVVCSSLNITNVSPAGAGVFTQSGCQVTFTVAQGFNGNVAFSYSIEDNDGNQCVATGAINVADPCASPYNVTTQKEDPTSSGGGNDGSITISASGGNAPYDYEISGPVNNSNTNGQFNNLPAGTYNITVTDDEGCVETTSVVLTLICELDINFNSTDVTCNGESDGSATATAIDGIAPFDFEWSTGFSESTGGSSTLNGLAAATYNVTVTDATGCEKERTVTILESSSLSPSFTVTDATTVGGTQGSITVSVSGGTPGYTYTLTPGGDSNSTGVFTGIGAGSYSVTIEDSEGCTVTIPQIIINEPGCDLAAVISGSENVSCNGADDGTATVIASGGDGNYTYSWSPSGGSGATATGLPAGTYVVTVFSDGGNCEASAAIQITEPTPMDADIAVTNITCNGYDNGELDLTVTGGTTPYDYDWSNGPSSQDQTGLSAGNYTVTITDAEGCTTTASGTVTEPAIIDINIDGTVEPSTVNGSDGSIDVTASGGTGVLTYTLTGPVNMSNTSGSFQNLPAGIYLITVTDINGCMETITITLADPECIFTVDLAPMGPISYCDAGDGVELTATASPAGNYNYDWMLYSAVISSGASNTFTATSPGIYSVLVTDTDTECTAMSNVVEIVIDDLPEPTVTILDGGLTACEDEPMTLSVAGAASSTFEWFEGIYDTGTSTGETGTTFMPSASGSYYVVETSADGCENGSNPIEVTLDPCLIDLSIEKTASVTEASVGDTFDFTITISNDGPSDATGVVVYDNLPFQVSSQGSTATLGTYSSATGLWIIGDIPNGGSETLTITVEVVEEGLIDNVAQVGAADQDDIDSTPGDDDGDDDENDEADEDDEDDAEVTATGVADISLMKDVNTNVVNVGDNVVFTITLNNDGPSTATNVVVTDELPAGLIYVGNSPSQGAYNPANGEWTVGTINVNGSATLQIEATVDAAGQIINVAEVTGMDQEDSDSTPDNNDPTEDDQDDAPLNGELIDLSITKDASVTEALIGDTFDYTIVVSNDGPSDATGVVVYEILPTQVDLEGFSATTGIWSSATGLWTVGNLAVGDSETLTITVEVIEDGIIDNVAQVGAADQPDIDSTPGDDDGDDDENDEPDEDDEDDAEVSGGAVADLELDKTVDTNSANVGDEVTFTITLENKGPSDANNIEVTDQLPDCLSFVSFDASLGSYNDATGIWGIAMLPEGDIETLEITAEVVAPGECVNVAEVTAADEEDIDSTPDNNDPDEDDQDEAPINGEQIDLSIEKVASVTEAQVGDTFMYTITVSNDGPSNATGVEVFDYLPSEVIYQGFSTTQGAWSPATGIWTVGDMPVGDSQTLTITVEVVAAGIIDNVAQVFDADQPDIDSTPGDDDGDDDENDEADEDDEDDAEVTGIGVADLELNKDADTNTANVGDPVTFTLTLTNLGPLDATNVEVTDDLPSCLTFDSSDASQGAFDGTVWTVGTVEVGAVKTLEITAIVAEAGACINVAEVTASDQEDTDSTPGNGDPTEDDQDDEPVNGEQIDLSIDKSASVTTAVVGDEFDYTIVVSNDGPSDATGVEVFENLPSQVQYVGFTTTQGNWSNGTGVWDVGSLANGANATLTITVKVIEAGDIDNVAQVGAADQPDIDSTPGDDDGDDDENDEADEDDEDDAEVTAAGLVDLELDKTIDTNSANVGDEVTFTITLENKGPSDANNIEVTDELPACLSFVSADASVGSYDDGTGIWSITMLPNGDVETLDITAEVVAPGECVNVAEVTAVDEEDVDSTPDNDDPTEDDQDDEPINGELIDLSIDKSASVTTAVIGDEFDFTIVVTNDGPSNATGVEVFDLLPSQVAYAGYNSTTGTYTPATGLWTVGGLNVGDSETLIITVEVVEAGLIDNVAQVGAADQPDIDSTPGDDDGDDDENDEADEDDEDDAEVTAAGLVDLELDKTVDTNIANVGDEVTFTITLENKGPSDANNIEVTDELPACLSFVSADASLGSYNDATGIWSITMLPNGDVETLDITAEVVASGECINVAEVTAVDEEDSDSTPDNDDPTEDDQDDEPISGELIDLSIAKDASVTEALIGDTFEYTIVITNDGPSDATGVEVFETLPAQVQYQGFNSTQGNWSNGTGVWNVGSLANGASATLTITVEVIEEGIIDNVAQVGAADQPDIDSTPGDDDGDDDENDEADEDDEDDAEVTASGVADLELLKDVNVTSVNVGDNIIYTLTLMNQGPSTATSVVVTDNLPAGLTYVGSNPTQGAYNPANGEWTVGSLNDGASATLQIEATVETGGQIINSAEVTNSDQEDPDSDPDNDDPTEDDQDDAPINGEIIDLSITKDASVTTALVGDSFDYTIVVTNDGPSDATGVQVFEQLPGQVQYMGYNTTQGIWSNSNGIWAVGSLAAGTSATMTVTVEVIGEGVIDNVAQVGAADQPDIDSTPGDDDGDDDENDEPDEDDEDDAEVSAGGVADLELDKDVDASSASVGDLVTFTITLTNDGPSTATSVEVTDELPACLSFDSYESTEGSYDSASGVWTIGTVTVGTTETLEITAMVVEAGECVNVAEVTNSDQEDPDSDPDNNDPDEDDQDEEPINGEQIDLSIDKSAPITTALVGDEFDYTIVVSNDGPSTATGVQVFEFLPSEVQYMGFATSQGAWSPTTGMWTVGTLADGASATLTVSVKVIAEGDIDNVAQVFAADQPDVDSTPGDDDSDDDENDEADEDDEDDHEITASGVADLELSKEADTNSANVGDDITFTITLVNNGPSDATGVAVTDQLPACLGFVSADESTGSYDDATGIWALGSIANGGMETLEITATLLTPGQCVNVAEVTASDQEDPDSDPDNDDPTEDDQDDEPVNGDLIDLSIEKTASVTTANVGDSFTYTIEVSNDGPSDATGVDVFDLLPAEVLFTGYDATLGTYSPATGIWTVGSIANGDSETLEITVEVVTEGLIDNVAQVLAADQPDVDSNPGDDDGDDDENDEADEDDEDDAEVQGVGIADLNLNKVANTSTAEVGDIVSFTITLMNEGPSTATNVIVTDELPACLSFESADPSQGSFDENSGLWTIGTVEVGATKILILNATVVDAGNCVNIAEVTYSDQEDPDSTPDNNDPSEDDQDDAPLTTELLCDIKVLVCNDTDGNGGQDLGEGGIPGAVLTLTDADGNLVDTGECDVDGLFNFDDLEPGTYTVCVDTDVEGYILSTPNCQEITLEGPDCLAEIGFCFTPDVPELGSIGDFVWDDIDGNGVQDAGEPGIPGVVVTLTDSNGNTTTTVTDGTGEYNFPDLPEGDYTVTIGDGPSGSILTTSGTDNVSLAEGENYTDADFGFYTEPEPEDSTIGDFVWNDLNNDGVQDPGEPGLPGVIVTLTDGSGATTTLVTDGTGYYDFTGLAPDTYTVTVGNGPLGSANTTPVTYTVTVTGGDDYNDADFGFYTEPAPEPADINGFVFADEDCDGVIDAGEQGVPSVLVTLTDADGNAYSTLTDDDGNYAFINLPAGTYTLTIGDGPAGYTLSTGGSITVNLSPDQTYTEGTFGFCPPEDPATIGDFVWDDLNNNGIQDAGEPGISGVTVTLTDAAGATTTVVTDGTGAYDFTGLAPGTYTVSVGAGPIGSAITTSTSYTVTVAGGDDYNDADFGFYTEPQPDPATIGDFVWDDANNNGIQDAGETGIAGVTVTLTDASGATTTAVTDGTGGYDFTNLAPGTYTVTVGAGPMGSAITTPVTYTVTVAGGDDYNDADFGFYTEPQPDPATIGDFVWDDANNNGIQDAGETGIAGVTVTLTDASGATTTAVTDGTGGYDFTNLAPGTYTVAVGAGPMGSAITTPVTYTVTVAGGDDYNDADFGFYTEPQPDPATIGDFVWDDANNNGIQDAGETGIAGVTVTLTDASGATTTVVTDGTGGYDFTNLAPGTYTVAVGAGPMGSAITTPVTYTVTVAGGDDYNDADFGFYTEPQPDPATIGDFVWDDLNNNGVLDAGEPGISAVTVTLTDASGATTTVVTDGTGAYDFTNLAPGTYTVTVGAGPIGSAITTPVTYTVTVAGGDDYNDADFGFYTEPQPDPATIGDFVWDDLNNNGVLDAGEPGISAVTVTLTDASGATTTVVTDGTGAYDFTNLAPGTYTVTVGAGPIGSAITTPVTYTVTVAGGDDYNDADFGFYTEPQPDPATIGDFVWDDANNNGIQDAGETGIAGVTVTLTDASGATTTVVTDGTGGYDFTNLAPGTYTVSVTGGPMGSNVTTASSYTVTVASGDDYNTADFGFYTEPQPDPATIGDFVWNDSNNNGVQDPGETGIAGVTVTLTDASGATSTVLTDGTGGYDFTNLAPGTYTVSVGSGPAGSSLTTGGSYTVTVAGGDDYNTADFGFYTEPQPDPASIGDFVWEDLNNNGQLDAGEPGISGVLVTITFPDGTSQSTYTDGTGAYDFTNLAPGAYTITVGSGPAGSSSTTPVSYSVTVAAGDDYDDADFGFYTEPAPDPASLGDFVWDDLNNDGVQDPGEPGIPGVVVTLTDSNGNITTTVTDGTGSYDFGNLIPGSYTVTIGAGPSGSSNTTPTSYSVVLNAGDDNDSADFGFHTEPDPELGSINGVVYGDEDCDGVVEAGETGLASVTVTLTFSDGNTITALTNGFGEYNFNNLPAGFYTITVGGAPAGYVASTGGTVSVTLTDGMMFTGGNFGFCPPVEEELSEICGTVYVDENCDGSFDPGELGIQGVGITLVNSDTTQIYNEFTNGFGEFCFEDLPSGTYTIAVGQGPVGAVNTTIDEFTITLNAGTNLGNTNFGFCPPEEVTPGSIGDFVWSDLDNDGVQDPGEPGIPGVIITLTDANGNTTTTVTDGGGSYNFIDVLPGNYTVTVGAGPSGTTLTTTGSYNVTIVDGQMFQNGDFGFFEAPDAPLGSIGDLVWDDQNGNGIHDAGEPGLPGVVVTITGPNGSQTTVSDNNGFYSFTDLPAGSYTVTVGSGPNGATVTTPNVYAVTLVPGMDNNTSDFGFFTEPDAPVGSIGNFVWNDLDNNGVQDPGEPGIPGVQVTITYPDGTTLSMTTNALGDYLFDNLPAGSYSVSVGAGPAGSNLTSPATFNVPLTPGQDYLIADFGFNTPDAEPLGSIGDFVWNDIDGDGVQDPGEPGLAGVVVTLTYPDGSTATTVTNGTGGFNFTNVPAGNYTVTVGAGPNGSIVTTPPSYSVVLNPGDNNTTSDFGFYTEPEEELGSIGDLVWYDENGNGLQDPGEAGIPGVTVTLTGPSGTQSVVTNGFGGYEFTDLPAGNYTVTIGAGPAGYTLSTPGTYTVTLGAGAMVDNADFGYEQIEESINSVGDFVWLDADADGIQDADENGIMGVTVVLYDAAGNVVNSTSTDANGAYNFTDLPDGVYYIVFGQPAGYDGTTPNQGTSDNSDSDADPVTGQTATFSLTGNTNETSIDAGFYQCASIGDFVFEDADGDGSYDSFEGPLKGIVVSLFDAAGNLVATTETDDFGNYDFDCIMPGNYTVSVPATSPNGVPLSTPSSYNVTLESGDDYNDADFGYGPVPAMIAGTVFDDTDNDGVQDPGEAGIGGVTVTLVDATGNIIATTVTLPNGNYSFGDLPGGTFTVEVGDGPAGSNITTPSSSTVTIDFGEEVTDVDFGFNTPPGNIDGTVFEDTDGDGVQDPGEPTISGVTVTLVDDNGNTVTTTVSGTNGEYTFTDVPAGDYTVVIGNGPTGTTPSTPTTVSVTVTPNNTTSDIDFGFEPQPGTLNGTVFDDLNGNGVQDPGEPGLSGVIVSVQDSNGNTIGTTITGAGGSYEFVNLTPGDYTVEVGDGPDGSNPTTPGNVSITITPGGSATVDFGFEEEEEDPGTVTGIVFDDNNDNGVQDPGEPGIGGVTVTLVDANGNTVATTVSGADGSYTFPGIDAGNYTVVVGDGPSGTNLTTPGSSTVTVTPGSTSTVDFGFNEIPEDPGTVTGIVFDDNNDNGVQDPGEPGIGGVTVTLVDANGNTVATTVSGADGSYTFPGIDAGNYTVVVGDGPDGTNLTTPGSSSVTVTPGSTSTVDFGFNEPAVIPGSVNGTVFDDNNDNGVQDAGEPGIGGVTVSLVDANGNTIATTVSGADGSYNFPGLTPGNYTVVVGSGPTGTNLTTAGSATVTVPAGGSASVDFGFNEPAVISGSVNGIVFDDNNENGVQDAGEPGIGGVTVSLVDANGNTIATTVSGADGSYNFPGLTPGNYTVVVGSGPTGTSLTTAGSATVTVPAGGSASADFGFNEDFVDPNNAFIGDYVWFDANQDGIQDADEIGAAGITVNLFDSNGSLIASTQTNAGGLYSFSGLAAGNYTVAIDLASLPADVIVVGSATTTVTLAASENYQDADFGLYDDSVLVECDDPTPICTQPVTPVTICLDWCIDGPVTVTETTTTFNCSIQTDGECFTYTALPLFSGTDDIIVVGCNAAGTCQTLIVPVTVADDCITSGNTPPVAQNDTYVTDGSPITLNVLSNDNDADGDPITITTFTQPSCGAVTLQGNSFLYTPTAGCDGTYTFTYQICDADACDEATVTIDVTQPCDNSMLLCAEPVTPIEICPDFCAFGPGDDVTITEATTTFNCSLQILDNGCLQYTALPLFAGQENIVITGCNQFGVCDTYIVTVNVTDDCSDFDASNFGDAATESNAGVVAKGTDLDENVVLSITGVTPNPAISNISVSFTSEATQNAEIVVLDITGKQMSTQIVEATTGTNMVGFNVQDYPAGIYIVSVNTGIENATIKFVKR